MPELQVALRYVVFAAFAASVLVALASWLVRTRRISPFGALGRTLRTASDPLIRPIETRLVRAGGNPVHAGWWLVVAVAAARGPLLTPLERPGRTPLRRGGPPPPGAAPGAPPPLPRLPGGGPPPGGGGAGRPPSRSTWCPGSSWSPWGGGCWRVVWAPPGPRVGSGRGTR